MMSLLGASTEGDAWEVRVVVELKQETGEQGEGNGEVGVRSKAVARKNEGEWGRAVGKMMRKGGGVCWGKYKERGSPRDNTYLQKKGEGIGWKS